MTRRALITGITGQDGACLAELLLARGYEVHGMKRRAPLFNTDAPVREMVEADVRLARRDALMARAGFRTALSCE